VEQLGAGSGAEGVEAFADSALELIGTHGRRLRRSTVIPSICVPAQVHPEHSRTPGLPYHRGGMSEPLVDELALPPNEQVAT
jgi:hypothetical protein